MTGSRRQGSLLQGVIMARSIGLSKSRILKGLQCQKLLYYSKYPPANFDRLSDPSLEQRFAEGTQVGILAQSLFPDGIEVPFEGLSFSDQIDKTKELISDGQEVIYEASFETDGVFVKVDILVKNGSSWDIYEVKSGTKVKDENLWDVAVQHYVLSQAGFSVNQCFLTHIDNGYIRHGDIDINQLFRSENITDEVIERLSSIPGLIKDLRAMLKDGEPDIDIGPHCLSPYECEYKPYCWQHIPEKSVFNLTGRKDKKFSFYSRGLVSYDELPLKELDAKQQQQVLSTLNKVDSEDVESIRSFLEGLWYPLCHLDFETFQTAVPLFDGSRPYQQLPFQYSLHLQNSEGAAVEHRDYLSGVGYDPRRELAEKLIHDIPSGACVLTYNKAFEIGVIRTLAEFFPDLAPELNSIIENVRDLMDPFRKRDVYRWEMEGSYSIKNVLPAMAPDLSYIGLPIADGGAAMLAYHEMTRAANPGDLSEIRQNLLRYCEMDTWAMVRILGELEKISSEF